jgi:hypothetical protein
MGFFSNLTKPRIPVIEAPRAGILDLLGAPAAELIASDRRFLVPLFGEIASSRNQAPRCHVLFMYCAINPDGTIQGTSSSLRALIRDSGAAVVVVASPNTGDAYVKAGKPEPFGRANLVMTLDRHGVAFGLFCEALFREMKRGVSMPVAWVKLAPQGPAAPPANTPACIFACEGGQLAFK